MDVVKNVLILLQLQQSAIVVKEQPYKLIFLHLILQQLLVLIGAVTSRSF